MICSLIITKDQSYTVTGMGHGTGEEDNMCWGASDAAERRNGESGASALRPAEPSSYAP